MLFLRDGPQLISAHRLLQEFDTATAGNRNFVIGIAGESEGGIREGKDQTTVANVEAIQHLFAHKHRCDRRTGFRDFDLYAKRLRCFVAGIHLVGTSLRSL